MKDIFNNSPYDLTKEEKEKFYREALMELTIKHYENCSMYKKLLDCFSFRPYEEHSVEEYPFLPVRLFKEYDLCSVPREDIVKTMTSSGTTGQSVSKIFLDKSTSANQTKTLVKITTDFIGKKRLPMLIIDTKSVVKDRRLFSARGSGILGFSMMGCDTTYALDENMQLDYEIVEAFLEKHKNEDIFLFGFTFIIWEHLYNKLKVDQRTLDLSRGILIHGGGFKKLIEEAVDNDTYKSELKKVCGIHKVYNYYGMVEQTGSIFMECECGRLHASNFSDIFIRNPKDFSICKTGEKGLIELVSILPESYPGHCILSEDIGEVVGVDVCPCGRKGKTFKIHGRIKQAEVRGCSDTYENR
ncbi:MAG: acyl-protein synthetase [Lachnotalea sp.]